MAACGAPAARRSPSRARPRQPSRAASRASAISPGWCTAGGRTRRLVSRTASPATRRSASRSSSIPARPGARPGDAFRRAIHQLDARPLSRPDGAPPAADRRGPLSRLRPRPRRRDGARARDGRHERAADPDRRAPDRARRRRRPPARPHARRPAGLRPPGPDADRHRGVGDRAQRVRLRPAAARVEFSLEGQGNARALVASVSATRAPGIADLPTSSTAATLADRHGHRHRRRAAADGQLRDRQRPRRAARRSRFGKLLPRGRSERATARRARRRR